MVYRLPVLLRTGALCCALALGAGTAGPFAPAALAATGHGDVVTETPVGWTPHVLDGTVKAIVQIGDTVVVGGDFSQVTGPDREGALSRGSIFAFEYGTGRILTDFAPELDGQVLSLATDGHSVYAGGTFQEVNGEPVRGIAKLSPVDGGLVRGFGATLDNGSVYRVATHDGYVYVGGSFRGVNGETRTGVARLDGADGLLDPGFDITIARPRGGALRVQELALSPDGGRLVINGTFLEVEGRPRAQIAMVDTGVVPARLSEWSTSAYAVDCDLSQTHTYLRQMDFAPDGEYFTVVTTGGNRQGPGMCKTASRWENGDTPGAQPTWVNRTGGDSLYSVAATGAAVYVGGHQRWLDNAGGSKSAGPGAAPRPGIGAIDPETGRALPWNPGRQRGHGVQALTATAGGLFVGSDTEWLAGRYRARLGMFPLS